MSSKQTIIGDVAEMKFMYEAKLKGLHINLPLGGDAPHDVVVDSGNGHMMRVQVKSATKKEKGRDSYRVSLTRGAEKDTLYTRRDCDIVAVYIAPQGCFYFIPIEQVRVGTWRFYPHDLHKDRENSDYYESWHFFG